MASGAAVKLQRTYFKTRAPSFLKMATAQIDVRGHILIRVLKTQPHSAAPCRKETTFCRRIEFLSQAKGYVGRRGHIVLFRGVSVPVNVPVKGACIFTLPGVTETGMEKYGSNISYALLSVDH